MLTNETSFEINVVYPKLKENFAKSELSFDGSSHHYDPEYGVDTELFFKFLNLTQKDEIKAILEESSEDFFLRELMKKVQEKGLLESLISGVKVKTPTGPQRDIYIYYTKPNNNVNPSEMDLYNKNLFFVDRQIVYKEHSGEEIDIGIGVNGFFLFAVELKSGTGETYMNAEKQLMERDLSTYFFKNILCSFAMDRQIIEMCADLHGIGSKFLPFNQGFEGGAGNDPSKLYRTDYFYEEIMTVENITNLIQYFIFNDGEKMVFPRYHQFKCTNNILEDVSKRFKNNEPLTNYLVSSSMGSGKSNMIAWTAYRLAYLNDDNNNKVFDSIIVVSNRLSINKHLTSTLNRMPHQDSFLVAPQRSYELKNAINKGTGRIILTNIQKFPWVVEGVHSTAGKRFAILIDEGHDSTTGEYIANAKMALSAEEKKSLKELIGKEDFTTDDIADLLAGKMKKTEGNIDNATFMAFTGTPKGETKMTFGVKVPQPDGRILYEPFFTYTMKQAIEEKFILDVLTKYTTYKTYCTAKCISNNEDIVQAALATKALSIAKLLDPEIILEKAGIALDFYDKKAGELNGNSKMMIVCNRREQVVRYYDSLCGLIDCAERDWKVLVAFSGELDYEGHKVNENDINKLPEGKTIEEVFHNNKNYRILVVADKFTVGFDEPYLTTMAVDDMLSGVRAVQTLCRLNRVCEGYDKKTAIIDFVNDYEDIVSAFEPYYNDAKYYREEHPDDLKKLAERVDKLGLIDYPELKEAAKYIIAAKYCESDEEWAKLTNTITDVIAKIDAMAEDWSQDVVKQVEKRKAVIWTIRRFVRFYEIKSQVDKIDDEELLYKHAFYVYLLFCIKNGGGIPPTIDVSKVVKFINISIENKGDYENPNYDDQIEVTSRVNTRKVKPQTIEMKTLEEVVREFNEAMGLSAHDTLFYEVVGFLRSNTFSQTALLQFDKFSDYKKKITDNATNWQCNVYKVITHSSAYPTLSSKPNFDWREDLLDPALRIIWRDSKAFDED